MWYKHEEYLFLDPKYTTYDWGFSSKLLEMWQNIQMSLIMPKTTIWNYNRDKAVSNFWEMSQIRVHTSMNAGFQNASPTSCHPDSLAFPGSPLLILKAIQVTLTLKTPCEQGYEIVNSTLLSFQTKYSIIWMWS